MSDTSPSPDALSVLTPPRRQIPLAAGGILIVTPIRVRQLSAFVAAITPAREALASPIEDLWALIAAHEDTLSEALAIACDVPRETIDALQPTEYLQALQALLEANADFFRSWLSLPAARIKLQTQSE